jgi:pimeloyl-ACP methyl ester carboxylesterase
MQIYYGRDIPEHLGLEPINPSDAQGFSLWPDSPNWSFQFLRQIAHSFSQGADFHELYLAVRHLEVGDFNGWFEACNGLAKEMEAAGDRSRSGGHRVSARQRYLRANTYYGAAGFFLSAANDLGAGAFQASRRCFDKFAELREGRIVPVEIPYENGASLPGYFFNPATAGDKARLPTLLMMSGGDGDAKEVYLKFGRAFSERGYKCLAFDGPGQGASVGRGLYARHDWEIVAGKCIDFLELQDDVDTDNIGIISGSMGGYYAPRAAAFEPRLKALCVWGGVYSFPQSVFSDEKSDQAAQFKAIFGVKTMAEAAEKVKRFSLQGVADKIQCPTLYVVGEAEMAFLHGPNDPYIPNDDYSAHAKRAYTEIPHDNKRMIVSRIGEPGATHCGCDSPASILEEICDWFDETLRNQ